MTIGRRAGTALALAACLSCGDGMVEPGPPPPPPPTPDPPRAAELTVRPDPVSFTALGDTIRLVAEVLDQHGEVMTGVRVAWTSAESSVATVDESGLVTAVANGRTAITARAGSAAATAAVTVRQEAESVSVTPAAVMFASVGDTATVTAAAVDANGYAIEDPEIGWASADTSVATVTAAGLVTARGAGETTVTVASGQVRATVEVSVMPAAASVVISPPALRFDALGDTARLTTEVKDGRGNVIEGAAVMWESGDDRVARVDGVGLVTSRGNGRVAVKATSGAASAEATVAVRQVARTIALSPPVLTLVEIGATAAVEAVVRDANGREVAEPELSWSSTDPAVASVSAGGLVTAEGIGEAEVSAAVDSLSAAVRVVVTVPSGDREVLELLYRALGGDGWIDNTNWLTDAPVGEWFGVHTNRSGRVDGLELRDNGLNGSIPGALGLLDELFSLDLSNNALTGQVPAEIGRLTALRDLVLGRSQLSGQLPAEMGAMSSLRYVYLSNTELSGPLPATFADLELENFYIGRTRLCVPRTLAAWYESIRDTDDPVRCVPTTTDRAALVALYRATGGEDWKRDDGWLSEAGINTWRGVTTDENGYVTALSLANNNLTGSLPPNLGELRQLERLHLYRNDLSGGIPPELGELERLRDLSLSGNRLEGSIPPELGNLTSLDTLYLSRNRLSGPIPGELGDLSALRRLALFENQLSGPLPSEIGKLNELRDLWLTDNLIEGPLPSELGDLKSIENLSLSRNRLTGTLPAELGNLARLKVLRLATNHLEGPLPPELAGMVALEEFIASRNRFTGPIPPELGAFSNLESLSLFENELSGPIPPELGRLARLEDLRLSDNRLSGGIPAALAQMASLETLSLGSNELTGPIPAELGSMESLKRLRVATNQLSGTIPAELGNLSTLEELVLHKNRLTGLIPPQLGALSSLRYLSLWRNELSGELPPEIGNLRSLEELIIIYNPGLSGLLPRSLLNLRALSELYAYGTGLCAQIDDEFTAWLAARDARLPECEVGQVERLALQAFHAETGGESWTGQDGWNTSEALDDWYGLTTRGGRVRTVELAANGLRGPLVPEIVNLTKLETLDVSSNGLAGGVPAALASMKELTTLRLGGNAELEGRLPFAWTGLSRLQLLTFDGTGLCASPSSTFQAWLGRIDVVAGATCGNPSEVRLSVPVVYLTQAIQRREGDVPLIAGRDALLRVFLTSDRPNAFFEPDAVAKFTRAGREVHRVVMERDGDMLATVFHEGDLVLSYNAVIPGEHIQPGTEMVVEADPGGVVPRAAGSVTRFPAEGATELSVIEVPPMDLTVIPVLEAAEPDSSIFEWTDNVGDDSPEVGLIKYAFPFGEFRARAREPYITSLDLTNEDDQWGLVLELEALRTLENGTGYWYGAASSVNGYVRGVAYLGGWVGMGKAWDTELAHEVGHNLDLKHAPCGGALGIDPDYPYADGGIGVWGFDFRDRTLVSPESRRDIMGYCYDRGWLSDYYFEKVIEYRERVEGDRARALAAAAAPPTDVLILWGGVVGGKLRLEAPFRTTAAARLPDTPGPYRIEGATGDGETEFSLGFEPAQDKFGNRYFFFTLPISGERAQALDRITLTGPEGTITVRSADLPPVSVVTDARTGRIRSILRGWEGDLPPALAGTPALDVSTARGMRETIRLPR